MWHTVGVRKVFVTILIIVIILVDHNYLLAIQALKIYFISSEKDFLQQNSEKQVLINEFSG